MKTRIIMKWYIAELLEQFVSILCDRLKTDDSDSEYSALFEYGNWEITNVGHVTTEKSH